MRKTQEILRLKWQQCRSHRAVVKALGVGLGTVSELVGRARRAGLTSSLGTFARHDVFWLRAGERW